MFIFKENMLSLYIKYIYIYNLNYININIYMFTVFSKYILYVCVFIYT